MMSPAVKNATTRQNHGCFCNSFVLFEVVKSLTLYVNILRELSNKISWFFQ